MNHEIVHKKCFESIIQKVFLRAKITFGTILTKKNRENVINAVLVVVWSAHFLVSLTKMVRGFASFPALAICIIFASLVRLRNVLPT